MIDIRNTPPPFPQGEPRFVEALRRKPEFHTYWDMSLEPQEDEADFRKGLDFHAEFPDPEKLLPHNKQILPFFVHPVLPSTAQ